MDDNLLLECLIAEGVEADTLAELDTATDDVAWVDAGGRAALAYEWTQGVHYEVQNRIEDSL